MLTDDPSQLRIAEDPDLDQEMTDPYLVRRIQDAFLKDKNQTVSHPG
jgi:hypothetical protein